MTHPGQSTVIRLLRLPHLVMRSDAYRWIPFLLTLFSTLGVASADSVTVDMEKAGEHYVFRLAPFATKPLPPDEAMRVYVAGGSSTAADIPPLLGSYDMDGNVLTFTPRFALRPGTSYRLVYRAGARSAPTERIFKVPEANAGPPTVVKEIYPTTDLLPENQLKFYLHFSAPMSRGEAYVRVHLVDESGKRIALPFLELDQELWDPSGRRLTIFFDPARVKRGLLPHEEAGVPIEDGKSYTLVVEKEWSDARGKPLQEDFKKTFRVGPADREPPSVQDWTVTAPKAGSRDPVIVEFPESLDEALLQRLIRIVMAAKREPIPGDILIDRNETRWRFTPDAPWHSGRYVVEVGTVLEDLAGNTLERPFEVDVFERVEERVARETETLVFVVAP